MKKSLLVLGALAVMAMAVSLIGCSKSESKPEKVDLTKISKDDVTDGNWKFQITYQTKDQKGKVTRISTPTLTLKVSDGKIKKDYGEWELTTQLPVGPTKYEKIGEMKVEDFIEAYPGLIQTVVDSIDPSSADIPYAYKTDKGYKASFSDAKDALGNRINVYFVFEKQ